MKDIYTQLKAATDVRCSRRDGYKETSESILVMFAYTYCTLSTSDSAHELLDRWCLGNMLGSALDTRLEHLVLMQ